MQKLAAARRVEDSANQIRYVRFAGDFPVQPLSNIWTDSTQAGFVDAKIYAVQTLTKVVQRCMLMTTEPGDLVDLRKALKGDYDDAVWEHLSGATSAPFQAGDHAQIAVKVIDDRGNELLVVRKL